MPKAFSNSAPVFSALGDETRLELVGRLCAEGPLSITRLTSGTSMSRQAVTKHLQILAGAGVVSDSRNGRERVWSLEREGIAPAQQHLDAIARDWDSALDRLKAFVEA